MYYSSIHNKIPSIFVITFLSSKNKSYIFTHAVPSSSALHSCCRAIWYHFPLSVQLSTLGIFLVNFNCLGLLIVSSLLSGTPPIHLCWGCPSLQGSLGGGGLVTKLCLTLVTPWTVAHQAPLSLGFPRQEYWSGLPLPSPGDLPDPGIEPKSPALLAGGFFTNRAPGKPFPKVGNWGSYMTHHFLL